MSTAKPVQLGLTPELLNYFEAINLHMKVHNQPKLKTLSTTKTTFIDPPVPKISPSTSLSSLSLQVDDAQVEARLVSEMMEQVRLIEQALVGFGEHADPKKIELDQDVQNSFNELWSENLSVLIKAIEFMLAICKDVHRYWPYLEGQMDRLVMACARVIGLMFTRYKSSLFVNAHDAIRAPIINLLNSTAQLFHSIIRKSPLLPSKISSETYSALFASLMPYYLLSSEEAKNLDQRIHSKIRSFISDMFCMSELNNLLLALLRVTNAKLVDLQDSAQHRNQMNVLIKWIVQLCSYLRDSNVSNLNLDLILNEADMLIRAYPSSIFESSRDFRLLEAIREIVFKIVEYKGDPGIWDHLIMIDLDKGDSGLIKYINIALERNQVLNGQSTPTVPKPIEISVWENSEKDIPVQQLVKNYKPIIPDGLNFLEQEDKESSYPEEIMFKYWLKNFAKTSDSLQSQLCLDYLNQNFDDLVSKFSESLEPIMDLLIRACTRQYHLFTTLYYPPNVGLASSQSLQMLHSTTSLLKRIFTSTISLSSATTRTLSHLILLIFSLRLPWSSDFSVESLTALESSILTNESLDKSQLICICIRLMRQIRKLNESTFGDIQRFALKMLTELILPLQFITFTMMAEEYDSKAILYEINEFLLTCDDEALQESFDRFLAKENLSERTEDNQSVIEQLIYEIIRHRGYFIYDYLKSLNTKTSALLLRFIHDLIALVTKPDFNNYNIVESVSTSQFDQPQPAKVPIRQSDAEFLHKFTGSQVPRYVVEELDYIQKIILPELRSQMKLWYWVSWFNGKLSELIKQYDQFVRYPVLLFTAVDSLTEVCSCAMFKFLDYTEEANVNQGDLMETYSKIGELLGKMFGNSDSLGHQHVTVESLRKLIQSNIGMMLKHGNRPKQQLAEHFQWIWDVHYALINHSKPYYLLPIALEAFNAFLMQSLDSNDSYSTETNYRLVQVFTSMLEHSCGQMFLYPTAIYTSQLDNEKFNVSPFLRQVDDLFNYYPMSYLEEERDYKILVLMRRVLHRLYDHHGLLIRHFWNSSSQFAKSQSPVYAFFEQLIEQNGDVEKYNAFLDSDYVKISEVEDYDFPEIQGNSEHSTKNGDGSIRKIDEDE